MNALTRTATALVCMAAPLLALAQPGATESLPGVDDLWEAQSIPARRIEGLWDEHVTIRNCKTGVALATLRATNLFIRGGALNAVNAAPPMSASPTYGQWWHEGQGINFGAKMRFFRFNPDGSYSGIREISREITLDEDANALTGTVDAQDYDTNDNLIQVICATETGTRVQSP